MADIRFSEGAVLGPSIALDAKPHKLALHVRGRIVLGLSSALWVPIVLAIRHFV